MSLEEVKQLIHKARLSVTRDVSVNIKNQKDCQYIMYLDSSYLMFDSKYMASMLQRIFGDKIVIDEFLSVEIIVNDVLQTELWVFFRINQ